MTDHQDWNVVTFSSKPNLPKKHISKPKILESNQEIKYEQPKQLGQLILQARTTCKKNQKELANQLGIAVQILSRWETNKKYLITNKLQILKNFKNKITKIKKSYSFY